MIDRLACSEILTVRYATSAMLTRATRLRRVLPALRRRTRAPSFQCQVIHAITGTALFMTVSHVAVLNKQVITCLRLLNNHKSCRRVQSWRHTWYVTIGASQPLRMIPRPETREARGMQLCLWWLHAPHAPYCMLCCTVTVAVLGGLVCAQSRSAFARDGSSERIYISRPRR